MRSRPRALLGAALPAAIFLALLLPSGASAARGLTTGFLEVPPAISTDAEANWSLDQAGAANAEMVRLTVPWGVVAPTQPAVQDNPADPAYKFALLDRQVRMLRARGFRVLLTLVSAPAWAQAPGRPDWAPPGTWRPNAAAFGAFGRAVALRYSGSFPDPLGGTLPRVSDFQAWNEPNLTEYITPQYEGQYLVGADIYRSLLNAMWSGVKSVHPDNLVITGGTAPYGDPPGVGRARPLAFARALLCVRGGKRLRAAPCPVKPLFDVFAHHPISTSGGPKASALNADDVSTPDLPALRRVLVASERQVHLTPSRHALWVTEFWWNTNPPNAIRGVSPIAQARFIEGALYEFWKAGASVALNLQLKDSPYVPAAPLTTSQSGLFYADGAPKPSFQTFRFPFVTDRIKPRVVRLWGKAPQAGRVRIQRRIGKRWRTVAKRRASRGGVFVAKIKLRGRGSFRAVSGAERSLVWKQR